MMLVYIAFWNCVYIARISKPPCLDIYSEWGLVEGFVGTCCYGYAEQVPACRGTQSSNGSHYSTQQRRKSILYSQKNFSQKKTRFHPSNEDIHTHSTSLWNERMHPSNAATVAWDSQIHTTLCVITCNYNDRHFIFILRLVVTRGIEPSIFWIPRGVSPVRMS